jgi:hypothetical protein
MIFANQAGRKSYLSLAPSPMLLLSRGYSAGRDESLEIQAFTPLMRRSSLDPERHYAQDSTSLISLA